MQRNFKFDSVSIGSGSLLRANFGKFAPENKFSIGIAQFVQTITKSFEELTTETPIGIKSALLSKAKESKPSGDNVTYKTIMFSTSLRCLFAI